MRIFFVGCVAFSRACLETLLEITRVAPDIMLVGVTTKKHSAFNADFCDLAPLCIKHQIPYHYTSNINDQESIAFMHSCKPDVVYCFGWSALIGQEILSHYPVIGYHPAALPQNRGRHPIIWALALGLEKSASSFFLMDTGADSGAILSQVPFDIAPNDTAKSLCSKVESIAKTQIQDFTMLLRNTMKEGFKSEGGGGATSYHTLIASLSTPQDHTCANLWRKRGARDGIIDFRMSALGIYNLIRALSEPYVGAEILYQEKHYKVWEARIIKVHAPNIEPGKVLRVDASGILIKAYDDAILCTRHTFYPLPKEGEYLYP